MSPIDHNHIGPLNWPPVPPALGGGGVALGGGPVMALAGGGMFIG